MDEGHSEVIISTIDAYLDTDNIDESDLGIIIQMDFDDESNDFRIDYTLTSYDEDPMEINTGFGYENLAAAWESYLDQIAEIHQNYQGADIRCAHPEEYKGGKLGGNPVMSIRDAEGGV